VNFVRDSLGHDQVSERRACRVLGQSRSTQRRQRVVPSDEPRLVREIIDLASQYGRYGYRRVTELLRRRGWKVNHKRVERLWRQEGLKVPQNSRNAGDCGSTTAPGDVHANGTHLDGRMRIESGPTVADSAWCSDLNYICGDEDANGVRLWSNSTCPSGRNEHSRDCSYISSFSA